MADSDFSKDQIIDNIVSQDILEDIHRELMAAISEKPFDQTTPEELMEKMTAVIQSNPLTKGRDFQIEDSFFGKLNFGITSSEIDNPVLVALRTKKCFCSGQWKICPCK
jgi:hypothetical protein